MRNVSKMIQVHTKGKYYFNAGDWAQSSVHKPRFSESCISNSQLYLNMLILYLHCNSISKTMKHLSRFTDYPGFLVIQVSWSPGLLVIFCYLGTGDLTLELFFSLIHFIGWSVDDSIFYLNLLLYFFYCI